MSEAAAKRNAAPLSVSPPVMDASQLYPGINPFPWHDPVQTIGGATAGGDALQLPGVSVPGLQLDALETMPADNIQWPDLNLQDWFPVSDGT